LEINLEESMFPAEAEIPDPEGTFVAPLPLVSVIVPAYNAADVIERCLSALQQQTYPSHCYEVIVVDDGSQDETAVLAAAAGKVISEGKRGKSGARNLGAARAHGELLLFTDADCEAAPEWIEQMVAPFLRDPDVVGVKGAYWSRQREPIARFTQVEVEERYDRMARQEEINFIDTYAAGYRRTVFLEHGGFDLSLPEVEDQDLSFRLARAGHKMVFAPDARVYHQHITSARRYFQRKFAIGTWKHLLINRYPERFVSDSRTPQTLKVQMVLVLAASVLLLLAPFSRTARWALALVMVSFLGVSLPFLYKAARRDPGVLPIAVPMLWIRAAALGYGYINGIIRFGRRTELNNA
jgi:cellulose synthase/poly-beta-1,6-N-acetylglucosamine synthase-like glycosyltransferase